MLIREVNLLKFVEQLLEFEETKQLSQLFSEKIATDNCALNEDGPQFLMVLSPIVSAESSLLFYLKPCDSYLFV